MAGAGGGVDAGLDRDTGRAGLAGDRDGDRTVAQVADRAGLHGDDAAHADAHPAAAGHKDAGAFGGVEDRGGAVGLDLAAVGEGDGAAFAGLDQDRSEPLGGQAEAAVCVVGLEGVERPAGPQA